MAILDASPADLRGRFVFLSASFPYGHRADRFAGSHPGDIADAVLAVARGVWSANGRLVFGGHPTISPLVLMVAVERPTTERGSVVIYQSRLFEALVTSETRDLERRGHGEIRWDSEAKGESLDDGLENLASLTKMRRRMLSETRPLAAYFIGGMEGIVEEAGLFAEVVPGAPILPIGRPGGAASELRASRDLPRHLVGLLRRSSLYPVLVASTLGYLTTVPHSGGSR